jgi:hypothetical protein
VSTIPNIFVTFAPQMQKEADLTTNYLSPGSICWAAFLAMGARLENSPNNLFLLDYYAV